MILVCYLRAQAQNGPDSLHLGIFLKSSCLKVFMIFEVLILRLPSCQLRLFREMPSQRWVAWLTGKNQQAKEESTALCWPLLGFKQRRPRCEQAAPWSPRRRRWLVGWLAWTLRACTPANSGRPGSVLESSHPRPPSWATPYLLLLARC